MISVFRVTCDVVLPVTGVDLSVPESPRVTGVLVRSSMGTLVVLLAVRGVRVEPIRVSAGDASWNEDLSVNVFWSLGEHSVRYEDGKME